MLPLFLCLPLSNLTYGSFCGDGASDTHRRLGLVLNVEGFSVILIIDREDLNAVRVVTFEKTLVRTGGRIKTPKSPLTTVSLAT